LKLYLFDDRVADAWHPFALTRPAGELLFGALLLRERLERYAGRPATASLTRPWLRSFQEPGAPVAVPRSAASPDHERLLLCSRFVPTIGERFEGRGQRPILLLAGDGVAGCYLPAGHPGPATEWLEEPEAGPVADHWETRIVSGALVGAAWQLITGNPGQLVADLTDDPRARGDSGEPPSGTFRVGGHAILLGEGVRVEPGVVFDTRDGPVALSDGVEVLAGSRIAGPFFAGRGTRLLGGPYERVGAGPECRLRGEIEDSVVLGYSNKAHGGFLGHSYIGRWVNLGALTTNSDLKNTYGPIRLGGPAEEVETGLTKLGCLLGDHVKTAIGTRIHAGTVVGAGANLFGDSAPERWVPAFAWGSGSDASVFERPRFVEVAARVLRRRGIDVDEATREWLGACWDARGAD
jgi:UDP-N-acetylglucosamine diphosphorylase/glucosamine-1-phosphate N-acetyltransferase